MSDPDSIALDEARRIALAAQGFHPARKPLKNATAVASLVRDLGALQIDSVNVLVRSHYLPLFSRCGPYDRTLLERAAYDERHLFEYWGHEASFLPIELYPLFGWRRERARRGEGTWGRLKKFVTDHHEAVAAVREQLRERGPLGAGELEGMKRGPGGWWGWSEGKEILEWLFWTGEATTARRRNFERLYDLTERVIPSEWISRKIAKEPAQRELMTIAARALGVATASDLRDYFRIPAADSVERITELLEQGVLIPTRVDGWKQIAYRHRDAKCPRRIEATALLSPFDSLIWERQRTERLFGFRYRLEIYTPAHKREHGYYVLPFLYDGRLVARVDLKADRARGRLLVKGGSVEEGIQERDLVECLRESLSSLAAWLRLDEVTLASRRGGLMKALRAR